MHGVRTAFAIGITTFSYLGGLPKVGSEYGAWPEFGWPADQGVGFFSALLGNCPVSL